MHSSFIKTLSVIVSVASLHTLALAADCPTGFTDHLCCESFGTFSDNYAVWHNQCGLDFANSTTVGSFCDPISTCPSGTIALCCATEASCGDVDGPLGINCVEVEN